MSGTQDPGPAAQHNQAGLGAQEAVLMMDEGESRKETNIQTTSDLLHPKQVFMVGTWNVRTLYQAGKLAQATKEMTNYNLDILAVCEARWTDFGQRDLASGHTILYSGREDNQHLNGVALIMSKSAKKSMTEWEPMGERLLKARFDSKYTKLTVIVCYAPQEDKDEEIKEEFYEMLNKTVETTPKHDMLLIVGDLNAKVGCENKGKEHIMGRHGLGMEMNDNGHRLSDFCEENNLVIGGTLFNHKDIHKYTWTAPNGRAKNQIDHIIINKKWRTSLLDVKTRRGADIASDHELLVGKIRLKLRKTKKADSRKAKFNLKKLKDEAVAQKFRLEVSNRFQILQDDQELNLEKFNQELLEVSNKLLGPSRKKKESWISEESWQIIDERKRVKSQFLNTKSERVKQQIQQEYKALDKQVKRSTKTDKKIFYDMMADKAEKASQRQDMKTLYQTAKELCKGYRNNDVPVKDTEGKLLSGATQKLTRWRQHFESILNREPPRLRTVIQEAANDLEIDTQAPTINEIKQAINSLNVGKAAGEDQVTAEMIKIEKEMTPKILHNIFKEIWEKEEIPQEWSVGLIVKLPKKGDLTQCGNWRGIMLLSITSKIFSRVLLNRMNPVVEPKLRKHQAGFRRGHSCSDHIFTLRQVFEQCQEWNATLLSNFIDFEKAFDSVHRPALWNILRHYGIPLKLVNIIKLLYKDFRAKVICGQDLTEALNINTGVKQGCILSPFLFCLAIDWIMKESTTNRQSGLRWTFQEILNDLEFADDIVLLSHSHRDMQTKTQLVQNNAQKLGLKINAAKTKVMRMNTNETGPIMIGNEEIEDVDAFPYLGSKITLDGNSESDIVERISKARKAFAALNNIWNSKKISTKTKIRFYKSNILTVLLYGAESWKQTAGIAKRLDVFQNKCLRRILKIFWPNTISNTNLMERTGLEPVSHIVNRRRWRWTGHVLRMESDAIPRVALRWTPQGKRKRGRPLETWRRSMEREMKGKKWSWGQLTKMAADRDKWRSTVSALCVDEAPRG